MQGVLFVESLRFTPGSPRRAEMKRSVAGLGDAMLLCTPVHIYMSRASDILGIDGKHCTADEGQGSTFSLLFPDTNYFDV